ncbi:MAG: type I DNA topoisomerase [Bacillota bacterium]
MSKKLVIVESPSKSKTIEQYLGKDYKVLSSKGHIRDLAISGPGGLGLDIENGFAPRYTVLKDKQTIVKNLKKETKNAESVYLATDPDREGEAISWHLEEVLDLKESEIPSRRVIFNEVTKDAVLEAFEHPRDIDFNLVSSQETRRILDRIIGFKLSKLLQNKIKSKSAGRVQSAALKILVDREKEVEAFNPEEYWKLTAHFPHFDAELSKVNSRKPKLSNEDQTDKVLDALSDTFSVDDLKKRERKRSAKPAFTTSTLQQEASNKLNMSGSRTMMVAQSLYEGINLGSETVGLITYMRTDSSRMSQSFIQPAKGFIKKHYGEKYVGRARPNQTKKNTQDAHEAVRPTNIKYHPDTVKKHLSRDEHRLYRMIYMRALASLMAPAEIESTTLDLKNNHTMFRAKAQALLFDGYLKLYKDYEKVDVSELPDFNVGDTLKSNSIEKSQHFTSPPPRYTEARLIKEMEELGIGRPSTYSQTIATLKKRNYVSIEEKKFIPTDRGKLTIDKLEGFFSDIISVDYTAKMETVLDDIAQGEADQTEVIESFYNTFIPMVEKANENMEKVAPKYTGENCPKCGRPMVYRESRYGTFEACSGYPECKYIKPNENKEEPEKTGLTCPKCKKGEIVKRTAKRGRNKGNTFYACNNFPKCKNVLRGKPTGEKCENCDDLMVELDDGSVVCNDKSCAAK